MVALHSAWQADAAVDHHRGEAVYATSYINPLVADNRVFHCRRTQLEELAGQMGALRSAWQADAAALAQLGQRAAGLEAGEAELAGLRADHARFQERVAMLQRLLTVRRPLLHGQRCFLHPEPLIIGREQGAMATVLASIRFGGGHAVG